VVQASYTYEPFGATSSTGTPGGNTFTYTGREDDGTGLKYYRARYYHPGLQRFASEDPIGYAGGDVNLYAYVRNDPLNATDPTGHLANIIIGSALGGAVGALKAAYSGCGIAEGFAKGAIVGGVAGATFGAGLPLLASAGLTGFAAADVSIISQNLKNALSGRKPRPASSVILEAAGEGLATATLSFAAGSFGRLAGDVATGVSPAFGTGIGRFFSTGFSANAAIFLGPAQGCR
jgi:RHS repeat-associated protein